MSAFLTESDGCVTLICATLATLFAEDNGGPALANSVGYDVSDQWPPEHNDSETRAWSRGMLDENPTESGYGAWYIVADKLVIGTAGFKGPPSPSGEVEIGYSVVPSAQRRGYGTAAAALLVSRAFRDPRVTAVLAETLPSLAASQKVLLANGFSLEGRRVDPEEGDVLCFRKPRGTTDDLPR